VSDDSRLLLLLGISIVLALSIFVYLYKLRRWPERKAARWATVLGCWPIAALAWGSASWWVVLLFILLVPAYAALCIEIVIRQRDHVQGQLKQTKQAVTSAASDGGGPPPERGSPE